MSYLGVGFKARPAFLPLQGTPAAKVGIGVRWLFWLARGWLPTTVALTIMTAVVVTVAQPIVLVGSFITGLAAVPKATRWASPLVGAFTILAALWWTWTGLDLTGQLAAIGLVLVWPIDALVGMRAGHYRVCRLWSEFRRGFPVRFSIMAAKSNKIQGPLDGEQQLPVGGRPILDHPALDHQAVFDGDTVWCRCTVSPGRRHEALREVLAELAASFVHVQRIDLVVANDQQSFGHLVVRFGPPLLSADCPQPTGGRLRRLAYIAPAYVGIGAGVALATWIFTTT